MQVIEPGPRAERSSWKRRAMEELSLHILDIVENSIRAGARNVEVSIEEDLERDLLRITIWDDGRGMDDEARRRVLDPFFTTKKERRVGMGLPLLADAARYAGGEIDVRSEPGRGTRVVATFQHSHIDRQPLGDLGETMEMLIIGNPGVDFVFKRRGSGGEWRLDTDEIREALGAVEINSAEGIWTIRAMIEARDRIERGG